MKTFFAYLLLALFFAANHHQASADHGMRIILNHGEASYDNDIYCSAPERAVIQEAFEEAMEEVDGAGDDRNLRVSRQTWYAWCQRMCWYWQPGTCWMAYRGCLNLARRHLEAEPEADEHVEEIRQLYDDEDMKDMDMMAAPLKFLPAEVECKDEVKAMKKVLEKELKDDLSKPCNKLLKKHATIQCLDL